AVPPGGSPAKRTRAEHLAGLDRDRQSLRFAINTHGAHAVLASRQLELEQRCLTIRLVVDVDRRVRLAVDTVEPWLDDRRFRLRRLGRWLALGATHDAALGRRPLAAASRVGPVGIAEL